MDKVISFLINNDNFVSGEEIGIKLGISRTAVWKHIELARQNGFVIESLRKKGYRISAFPKNRISPEVVEYYYKDKLPFELISLENTDSTNNYAKKTAMTGKLNDFLVSSDAQTGGRGRLSRKWSSEPGNDLTFSLCLNLNTDVSEFYRYTISAALSVFEVLSVVLKTTDADIKIKWPNDIYADGKKISGILSEMITEGMIIKYLIIGIGINVNSSPPEKAVSIKKLVKSEPDRNLLLSEIIKRLNINILSVKKGRFESVFNKWKSNLGWLGEEIKFDTGRKIITGIFKDISNSGAIKIESGGVENIYYSGDLI